MDERKPLFDFERVNGIHFLTDYYSVLGVPLDSPADKINDAYRQKAMEYHPDRYEGLAPAARNTAEFQMRVINQAREVLIDPEKRLTYDTLLTSWDGPISPDGTPVLDLSRPYYGAETSEHALQYAEEINALGLEQIGFNEKMLETIKKVHDDPDNEETAALLDELLRKKQSAINFQEQTLRAMLNVGKANTASPSQNYLDEARAAVDSAMERIERNKERTANLLESGVIFMIGSPQTPGNDIPRSLQPASMVDEEIFKARAAQILELAQQNEDIMAERLMLVRGTYIGEQELSYDKVAIKLKMGDGEIMMAFERKGTTMFLTDLDEEELGGLFTDHGAKSAYKEGTNVIEVIVPEGLPWMSVMEQVITDHYSFAEEPEN